MIVAARRRFDVRLIAAGHRELSVQCVAVRSQFFSVRLAEWSDAGYRPLPLLSLTDVTASTNQDWHEYAHRCRIAFTFHQSFCDRLAATARTATLLLVHDNDVSARCGAEELKRYLEMLEAQRRYDCGWGVGGYTRPVRGEIDRLGGLWLNKHKGWAMPDRPSWLHILSLLPGEF